MVQPLIFLIRNYFGDPGCGEPSNGVVVMCIYTLEPETVDRFYESKFSAEECLNKMQLWGADLSYMFSHYQNFPSAIILLGPLAFYTHLSQEPPQQHRLALTVWV